jgi:hypothetical protein
LAESPERLLTAPVDEKTAIEIARTGTKEQDNQGNTLVVNWQNHGGMVLISGLFPRIWEKKAVVPTTGAAPGPQDSHLKNYINSNWASSPLTVPVVRCGLHWVTHLGGVNYQEAAEALRELESTDLAVIKGVVTEPVVMRPDNSHPTFLFLLEKDR